MRSVTCVARSSTTCAREWGRRRASASSGRASDHCCDVVSAAWLDSSGQRLLGFDRKLGCASSRVPTRPVAARSPGRSSSRASSSTTSCLRGARVRPLAALNDSKQVLGPGARSPLRGGRRVRVGDQHADRSRRAPSTERGCTARTSRACARCSSDLHPPAEACLVDGFRLGPSAPPHRAIVDGDARSAAIAAASIVAKVVRDRVMRRLDALYPHYGFISHVGYITPAHNEAVRAFGPSELHRRSFQAACYPTRPREPRRAPRAPSLPASRIPAARGQRARRALRARSRPAARAARRSWSR